MKYNVLETLNLLLILDKFGIMLLFDTCRGNQKGERPFSLRQLWELPKTVTPKNRKALILNNNTPHKYNEAVGGGAPMLHLL